MKKYSLLLSIFLFLLSPTIVEAKLSNSVVTDQVNSFRQQSDLVELKNDDRLCGEAEVRLEEIKVRWAHDMEDLYRIRKEYKYKVVGENLAKNFNNEKDLTNAWYNSKTHKANILGNYTHACIKCDDSSCVELFRK